MKKFDRKGQFSIIAALLVSIVLVTAIITTYSLLRNNPIQGRPEILGAIAEMNLAIERNLEFAVGYYGSILQVTGNTTYARDLTGDYLQSSLGNIADEHPNWSPFFFELTSSDVSASWFNRSSSTRGTIDVTYSLLGLGISGIKYTSSIGLSVTVNPSNTSSVIIEVTRNEGRSYSSLDENNFYFYFYDYADSTWYLNNTGVAVNSILPTESKTAYNITIPLGVDPSSYILRVVDTRGISVSASTFSHYMYTFDWNQTLYSSLSEDTMMVELRQNGTLNWLGQNLQMTNTGKPIPPIPVKAFHINQTIDGVSYEVPFQVEDWGSNYRAPAGLTSNASVFGSRQMFVFLATHEVESTTLWWDGRDIANQTPYAYTNRYFQGDDPVSRILTNGMLRLTFSSSGFTVTSSLVGSSLTATASFLRINDENPVYGASPAYVIHHGIVRDIVQQEAEYSGGISGCPNIYAQIVLTLPANATYYTYALRPIFVDSLQSRTLNDLRTIRVTVSDGQQLTENGTFGGYPITTTTTGLFYNYSASSDWKHHWSQFRSGDRGAGLMFTESANRKLYIFDDIAGDKTGAIRVTSLDRAIEFKPVAIAPASFQHALDITWHGAVVNFDGTDPIYPASGNVGLWVMVESPPSITWSNG
jgi:hypothetical protein